MSSSDPNTSLITALITASTAFFGAIFAQTVSHWFAVARDDRKYRQDVYEKLFAPIIFDLFLFLDASTHFRRGHDVPQDSPGKLRTRVVTHVEQHLSLATPRLIAAFYGTKRQEYIDDDESDYAGVSEQIEFFYVLVDEFYPLAKQIGILRGAPLKEVRRYRNLYLIWLISAKLHYSEQADVLLTHKWLLDTNRIGWHFDRRLEATLERARSRRFGWEDQVQEFEQLIIDRLAENPEAKSILMEVVALR